MRTFITLVISKLLLFIERIGKIISFRMQLAYRRNEAHRLRRKVIRKKKKSTVDRELKKKIKEYAESRFGSSAYWPYLALYTEIRGQFLTGWVPADYYELVLLPKINPPEYGYLSDHKTFDYRLFGSFAVKPLFVFISGIFFDSDLERLDENAARLKLAEFNDKVVIKEEAGLQGEQVTIIHSSEFTIEFLNKEKNYTIQPYIRQYKTLNELYPESVNTFRVTTFLNRDGSCEVKTVFLRFGAKGSKIDNLSAGGQCLFFDKIGNNAKISYDKLGFELGDCHEDTGVKYAGISIPMFKEMLEECIKAHKKYPYVKLIGWDVCLDYAGVPRLLEWNTFNPAFWRMEAKFGPFWPDDKEILP